MTEVLERERKWEVDDDFVLPSLDDIIPGGEVQHSTIELTSAYFDTADRDLSAHGPLLRRREGDDDTGWQLKMPDSNGRIEIRYPLADTMPSDLSALVTGVSLGKQLVNMATIHTTRKRSRITDPKNHQLVAEIAGGPGRLERRLHRRGLEPAARAAVAVLSRAARIRGGSGRQPAGRSRPAHPRKISVAGALQLCSHQYGGGQGSKTDRSESG